MIHKIEILLPEWYQDFFNENNEKVFASDVDKAQVVLDLLKVHLENKSGGPFSSAIFNSDGKLVSLGMNLVLNSKNSTAHAEMLSIQIAQAILGTHNLKTTGNFVLVASAQPCAQCCGAIPWSGISKVIYSANAEDSEKLGFDEGPIHPKWQDEFAKRGIAVVAELERAKAVQIMQSYTGPIYNT